METKEATSITQKKDEESRREFLIKAGKMALYIPPAMMVLMHPSRNAFACSKSVSIRPNCGGGGNFFGPGGPGPGGHGPGGHGPGGHGPGGPGPGGPGPGGHGPGGWN